MFYSEALTASIIFGVIAILFLVMGILIKYCKCYWLIAGYNTATEKEKENIDIKGVSSVVGEMCLILAGYLILVLLLMVYNQKLIAIGLLFVCVPTNVIMVSMRTKKFIKHNAKTSSASQKGVVLGIMIAIVPVIILVSMPAIFLSNSEPKITIGDNSIYINSNVVNFKDITRLELSDNPPKDLYKVSGTTFLDNASGTYSVRGLGKGRLYVHLNSKPFLYIFTSNTFYIINYKDGDKTKNIHKILTDKWKQ